MHLAWKYSRPAARGGDVELAPDDTKNGGYDPPFSKFYVGLRRNAKIELSFVFAGLHVGCGFTDAVAKVIQLGAADLALL